MDVYYADRMGSIKNAIYLVFTFVILALATNAAAQDEKAVGGPDSVEYSVAKHVEALGRISSYHLQIKASGTGTKSGEVIVPLKTDSITDVWRKGLLRRERERAYRAGAQASKEPNGDMNEWAMDAVHVYGLTGWDPEQKHDLPIEFGRSASEFASIQGRIGLRNPGYDTQLYEDRVLLFHVVAGAGLSELASVAELKVHPQPNASIMRIEIGTSSDSRLDGVVGPIAVDLDRAHGYMISRIEYKFKDLEGHLVNEVLRFQEAEPGLFIPVHVKRTINSNAVNLVRTTDFELTVCDINCELDSSEFVVDFPEGIKVVETTGDGSGHKMHIWGKGGPFKTFSTNDDFQEYVYARARDYQNSGGKVGSGRAGIPVSGSWLLWVNVGLILILGILVALKRRFSH